MSDGRHPFAGQHIAVLGLGRAGLPSARTLARLGATVRAWDDSPHAIADAQAQGVATGPLDDIAGYDALLLSPGIPHGLPAPHPVAAAARKACVPILCDVEFLYRAVRATGSQARFVGITGTNGKSTTTALLGHILDVAGRPNAVGGNLGPAALELLAPAAGGLKMLGSDGVYVLEMSSYMLERIATVRFSLAAMLNLSPDHLDRHGDMDGYARAKRHIFDRQDSSCVAVIGQDDALTASTPTGVAQKTPISGGTRQPGGVWAEGSALRDDAGVIADLARAAALPGTHNAQNAAAAAALALALGVAREKVAAGIQSFAGLPHRQERVAVRHGVAFVNDSKATNADSSTRALACYERVHWIAGGIGKAGGIESLVPLFPRIATAWLIGRDAQDFAATLAAHGVPHRVVGTLDAAVAQAAAAARAGDTVLLSPAAASFDQFANFEARGDRFRALVASLSNGKAA
jgi:UDP-N-acetylmuramoylalanine--D-glutamate ligase